MHSFMSTYHQMRSIMPNMVFVRVDHVKQHCCSYQKLCQNQQRYAPSSQALDFSGAFDTINLEILHKILNNFMDTTTALWFRSYLIGLCQSTKYCNAIFDKREVLSGVTQDSVLVLALPYSHYISIFCMPASQQGM